jgi:phytoene synthase
MSSAATSDHSAQDAVIASARSGEPDRYIAALLAPAAVRADLIAIAAFAAEIAHIGLMVTREPAMGQVRLQWWRDAFEMPEALSTGHPVADAVRAAVRRHGLAEERFAGIIDAHAADVEPDPFRNDADLDLYLAETHGAVFALSADVLLAGEHPSALAPSIAAAGRAYGLARLLLGLGGSIARGRLPIPHTRLQAAGFTRTGASSEAERAAYGRLVRDLAAEARASLALARRDVAKLPRVARIAFHPLALVEPYVRALEWTAGDPQARAGTVAPLTRMLRIAGAHWLGRL